MKKQYYLLLLFYALLTVSAIVFVTLDSLKIDLLHSFKNIWLAERFVFSVFLECPNQSLSQRPYSHH